MLRLFAIEELSTYRSLTVGGHVTTATLNQSAMTKWHPEMEGAG